MRNDRHAIYGFIATIGKLGLLKKSPYAIKKFGKIMLQLYRDRTQAPGDDYGNDWGT